MVQQRHRPPNMSLQGRTAHVTFRLYWACVTSHAPLFTPLKHHIAGHDTSKVHSADVSMESATLGCLKLSTYSFWDRPTSHPVETDAFLINDAKIFRNKYKWYGKNDQVVQRATTRITQGSFSCSWG